MKSKMTIKVNSTNQHIAGSRCIAPYLKEQGIGSVTAGLFDPDIVRAHFSIPGSIERHVIERLRDTAR
jgi:hypothetical protein